MPSSADHAASSPSRLPLCLLIGMIAALSAFVAVRVTRNPESALSAPQSGDRLPLAVRLEFETSGFSLTIPDRWDADASLLEIKDVWFQHVQDRRREFEHAVVAGGGGITGQVESRFRLAQLLMSQGQATAASEVLHSIRELLENEGGPLLQRYLTSVIYFQGVAALRRGEDENCIMCRGESSCIVPISEAAVHQNPDGSRQAIVHFREYLEECPNDLGVRWLLNLAHMTLGEYPAGVDPRFRLPLTTFLDSEFDIGRFRDVGHSAGCNRFDQSGGAILDDFDGDGFLDLAVTSFDVQKHMGVYRNDGHGQFEDCSEAAGVTGQLGGLNCVQADYNNDGLVDLFIIRGAWLNSPVRPTLLRNEGEFRFSDVTEEAGLAQPVNSNAAQWADYDNDGWLDLFVCCEAQDHLLYRNLGNGTFEEQAGVAGLNQGRQDFGKGCTWVDIDNDDYPDLYINYLKGPGQLFRNNGDRTFARATHLLQGGGAEVGFSCWSWDFNNDGWLDIFAASYAHTLNDVVRGLIGEPHQIPSNKLFLNRQGEGFQDVTAEMGLQMVCSAMGSNYGDFDNDGFLDFYLGTGDPDLGMLVPNRMFRNVGGDRFAEITVSAGVGHLQKGHGVACGDYDRDGDVDLFVQLGGAVPGDQFHNALFQNPGHGRSWITLQLNGVQTNRSAIGARIKVVTSADAPRTIHRHVSSGSSFGGNPLEQTIGLGDAAGVDHIEVHWPTSGTTQLFQDVPVDRILRITEFSDELEIITPGHSLEPGQATRRANNEVR